MMDLAWRPWRRRRKSANPLLALPPERPRVPKRRQDDRSHETPVLPAQVPLRKLLAPPRASFGVARLGAFGAGLGGVVLWWVLWQLGSGLLLLRVASVPVGLLGGLVATELIERRSGDGAASSAWTYGTFVGLGAAALVYLLGS